MAQLSPDSAIRVARSQDNDAEYQVLKNLLDLFRDNDNVVIRYDYHWQPRAGRNSPASGQSDIILVIPEKGLFLLEVKASRGFKNQFGKHSVLNNNNYEQTKCPFEQAKRNLDEVKNDIADWIGRPVDFPCHWAVAFPNLDMANVHIDNIDLKNRIFCSIDLARKPQFLLRLNQLFPIANPLNINFNQEDFRLVLQCLDTSMELAPVSDLRLAVSDRIFDSVSKEQAAFLANLIEGRKSNVVTGPAGSGKTLMGLAAAKRYLCERDNGEQPKIVFLCWMKLLARWIRLNNPNSGFEIKSFHKFVADEASLIRMPRPVGIDPNVYLSVLRQIMERRGRFIDLLIVDESQDFDHRFLGALQNLVKVDGAVYFLLDSDQTIFLRLENQNRLVLIPDGHQTQLSENTRNSKNIARLAGRILRDITNSEDLVVSSSLFVPEGKPPLVAAFSDPTERVNQARSFLKKWLADGICPSRIVVLTPSRADLLAGAIGNIDYTLNGVSKRVIMLQDSDGQSDAPLTTWMAGRGILCTTISAFKGMESSHVLVCGLHFQTQGDQSWSLRQAYLATTRALNVLAFVLENEGGKEYILGKMGVLE